MVNWNLRVSVPRRAGMRFAAILFSAAAIGIAQSSGPEGKLLVLNKEDDTVSVVDLRSGKELTRQVTGPQPNEVSVSPNRKVAAITNMGTGPGSPKPGWTMSIFDLGALKVTRTIDLRPHGTAHGMAWINDERLLFTSHESDSVNELDVKTGKIIKSIPTGQKGTHLVLFDSRVKRAYAVNAFSGSVSVLDVEKGAVIKNIPTGARAEGISLSPDGKWLACGNVAANSVSIIDTEKLEVTRTLEQVGAPIRTLFTPDGKTLIVSSLGSGRLELFGTGNWTAKGSVSFESVDSPGGKATPMNLWADSSDRIYVALVSASRVAEVSSRTWKVERTFETGRVPDGIAVAAHL